METILNHHTCLSQLFSALFQYLYYESTAVTNILIFTVRESILDVGISSVITHILILPLDVRI